MRTEASEKDGLHLEVREIKPVRKTIGRLSEMWETEQERHIYFPPVKAKKGKVQCTSVWLTVSNTIVQKDGT